MFFSRRKFLKSLYLITSFLLLGLSSLKIKNKKFVWYLNKSDK